MCYYCHFLFWGGAFRVLWQWLCILPEYKGNSYPTICSMFVATISILSCCAIKQKEPRRIAEALSGIIHLRKQSARSRDRTGTGVTPLVFETNASTNSAIRAVDILFLFGRPGAKVVKDVGMYNTPTITFRRFVGAPMEMVCQLSCRIGTA